MKQLRPYIPGAVCLLGFVGVTVGAHATLRHLGEILKAAEGLVGAETAALLGGIFGQLAGAVIVPALLLPAGVFLLLSFIGYRRPRVTAVAFVPAGLIAYAVSVLFARVNGVRFWDIVTSLAEMAQNGLFDVL